MATGNSSVDMTRVILDISFDLDLVRVESWDKQNMHYLGNVQGGAPADDFLKKLTAKLNKAFPGDSVPLNVSGFTIVAKQ